VTNISDDNPAVPSPATTGVDYGPAMPGTYSGSFILSGATPIPFSYTLASPPSGYRRSYRFTLVKYAEQLNHCVTMVTEPGALQYEDVPVSSSGTSSGNIPTNAPIYARFLVGSGCSGVSNLYSSNPEIGNAYAGTTYGPLPAGSWEGSFDWQYSPSSGTQSVDFSYALEAPSDGYKRTYVITLVSFVDSVNSCRFDGSDTHTDEKLP
jgi:hypothetical protein